MAAPAGPPARHENLLTQKLGPLATWVWLAIATVAMGGFYLWEKHKQGSSATSPATAGSAVSASQVPDYIVQNYLGNTPSGSVPPSQPAPAGTPPGTGTVASPGPITATPRPTQITASGADTGDLKGIARSYGLTEAQLVAANPALKTMTITVGGKKVKLYGSGQPVPKGTVIRIPPLPS